MQQIRRAVRAPAAAGQPLVKLHRARLLEQVDDRIRVGTERERDAGIAHRPRRSDAVRQVALGRRAEADARSRAAQQSDIRLTQVSAVDRHQVALHGAGVPQQLCW